MNNKFVVVGDTHCSPTSLGIISKLFDLLNKYKDYTPIFLGDFFHSRNRLDTRFLINLFEIISKYKNEAIVISGNHDFLDNNMSLISILPDNFKKILKPETLNMGEYKFIFFPYATPNDETKSFIKSNASEDSILFSHIVIDIMTDVNLESFPKEIFEDYRAVINGHIHISKIKGNIIQPGAIYPVSISEINSYNPFLTFIEDGQIVNVVPLKFFNVVESDVFDDNLNTEYTIVKTKNKDLLPEYDKAFKIIFIGEKEKTKTLSNVLEVKLSFEDMLKDQILKANLDDKVLNTLKKTLPENLNLWGDESIVENMLEFMEINLSEANKIKKRVSQDANNVFDFGAN